MVLLLQRAKCHVCLCTHCWLSVPNLFLQLSASPQSFFKTSPGSKSSPVFCLPSPCLNSFFFLSTFVKLSFLPFYTILPWWELHLLPPAEFQEEKPEVLRWLIINLCGGRTRSSWSRQQNNSVVSESLPLSWLLLGIREKGCCVDIESESSLLEDSK